MNKNKWIAVFVSLAILTYLLFGGPLVNLFSNQTQGVSIETEMSDTIKTEDLITGTGELVGVGDILTVHYTGALTDGRVFDSSLGRNTPFTFTLGLGQVIRGWDEGLVGMRVGGKRLLTIPPEYGYGSQSVGAIPPNSILIFEVELLSVEKQ